MTEFELIDRFVRVLPQAGEGVVLGPGDDAALLRAPAGEDLAATVDAVVEGVHFDARFSAEDVGWKALAVNLSDVAAMGARPRWALVALALPRGTSTARVEGVARGLGACARRHGVAVVGGNVTRAAELAVTVTVVGSVRRGRALRRDGARPGDVVLVSGTVGDAALGVEPGAAAPLAARQRRPAPRLELGRALAGIASSAVDVSDGLVQDLGHVCAASGVAAEVRAGDLPLSPAYRAATRGRDAPWTPALAGGEDYELLVTVAPHRLAAALRAARRAGTPLTAIGEIRRARGGGVRVRAPDGAVLPPVRGHDHLAGGRSLGVPRGTP
jgi:thiamine-monophosphate kinase